MQDTYMSNSGIAYETDDEIGVDIRDVLYILLRRWPLLVAGLLCGAVLLGTFGIWKGGKNAASESTLSIGEQMVSIDEQIEEAREKLGPARSAEIDGLYTQYREYAMLQSLLRDQYVEYMRDIDRVDSSYLKTVKYLCTGEDVSPTGIFDTNSVLSDQDCIEIGKIIEGETSLKRASMLSRNRVYFSVDNGSKLAVSAEAVLPVRFILTVRIVGEYKGQCDQIQTVVERKMLKMQQDYVNAGGVLEMKQFFSGYTNDVASFMKDTINGTSTQLRSVTDNLFYFQQNTIEKLDEDAKAYYKLLKEQALSKTEEEKAAEEATAEDAPAPAGSWRNYLDKKYVVFGALAGIVLATMLIMIFYGLGSSLQSRESFQSMYSIPLNAALCKKGERASALRMRIYRLFHTADELTEQRAAALAEDLGIEMEKKEAGSLYILVPDEEKELQALAGELEKEMSVRHQGLSVRLGDPLNDPEQMQSLSDADAALLLVELRRTRRETAGRQLQMCSRYCVPVMGSVTLEVI